jgi:plastocyanin domain-containing protein
MNKVLIGSLVLIVLAVGGIFFLLSTPGASAPGTAAGSQANVTQADGKQVIQIVAKGGYLPRTTLAKANMLTTLNMVTNGTFDCSSALSIPSLGFRKSLPASGITPIEIPPQPAGTIVKGVCAMGMYNFAISFN